MSKIKECIACGCTMPCAAKERMSPIDTYWIVHCPDCGVQTEVYESSDAAIAAWNEMNTVSEEETT